MSRLRRFARGYFRRWTAPLGLAVYAAVVAMASLWWAANLPVLYLAGVAIVGALLIYEQSLVSADDLSQVKKAFDLNGWVGIVYFGSTALALYLG